MSAEGMGKTMTFRSIEKSRANEICGTCDLVRTEVVHEDGTVDVHVKVVADGAWVDVRKTRHYDGPLDLERILAARLQSGWTVAS